MNTTNTLILLAALSVAMVARAQTASSPAATPAATVLTNVQNSAPAVPPPQSGPPPAATPGATVISNVAVGAPTLAEGTNMPTAGPGGEVSGQPDEPAVPTFVPSNSTNGLRLNFRNASLDQVLNYLSEAAGFIVVMDTQPRGKVDIFSSTPVTRDEAVNLVDQALRKNGYAAIRYGRTLRIVSRDEAKIQPIPVFVGGDPDKIPMTDQIVTQIIPVRFVEVGTLMKDLQPLVSTQTTMTADESANEIVITDTQANIHKVAEIIKDIDSGAEDLTIVRVFRLVNADPTEMADELGNLFPDDSRSGSGASPVFGTPGGGFRSLFRGGGFGGGFGGGGFGGGAPGGGAPGGTSGGSNNQNQRIKKRARVVAVADPRTSSLVVSAAQDLMEQITEVITRLDASAAKKKSVKVFRINNADPNDVMAVLQDAFQQSGSAGSKNNSSQSALQKRAQTQTTSSSTSSSGSSSSGGRSGGGSSFGGP